MEPITVGLTIELGALILAGIGAVATYLHRRNQRALDEQEARHEQEKSQLAKRHHKQVMETISRRRRSKIAKGRAARGSN